MKCFSNWSSKAETSAAIFLECGILGFGFPFQGTESTEASLSKKQFSTENFNWFAESQHYVIHLCGSIRHNV